MSNVKRKLILDLESDNLLLDAKHIWVVCAQDYNTKEEFTIYNAHDLKELLKNYDEVIGHNIVMFDMPVLKRLWGIDYDYRILVDTLIISRLLLPDRNGGHSLDIWGKRLGCFKGEFKDFSKLSEEMVAYCQQDVRVTRKIYESLRSEASPYSQQISKAIKLEHEFAHIINLQIQSGFRLDKEKVETLYDTLKQEELPLHEEVKLLMPKVRDETHYKKLKEEGNIISETKYDYTYITPKTRKVSKKEFKFEEPNPMSRTQLIKWFMSKGWKPKEFTEKGNPEINETVLLSMNDDTANKVARLFRLQKQMSMIKDADGGWLNYYRQDTGRVHGSVTTNGANTGRCTHCVPMDSQALTRDGWKHYDDLIIGEDVLAFNMQTKTKEWTPILSKSKFNDRQVGELGNGNVRLRCTADHKWVTYQKSRDAEYYRLKKASELKHYDAILTNAPYNNVNPYYEFNLPLNKYNYNHIPAITKMSPGQLDAFLLGFLLADGYLRPSTLGGTYSWSFAQAEGSILEAARIALYLSSSTRVSTTCKTKLKGSNQRYGYNITQTQVAHVRSQGGMQWRPTSVEDVWCIETALDTWVMKQGEVITITGNSKPNLAQVDKKDLRMREVWIAPEGRDLVGSDAAGLELRVLGHYLHRYDDGAFSIECVEGDVHTYNQNIMGLAERNSAKTAIYALIYGAGNEKLGTVFAADQKMYGSDENKLKFLGGKLRSSIIENFTGYSELVDTVQKAYKERGYLIGLDGRPLHPRSDYSALNLLIQSAGAIICKQWTINTYNILIEMGYIYGDDWEFHGNIHDEYILSCKPELSNIIKDVSPKAMRLAQEQLGVKTRLDTDTRIGKNWKEIH